MKLNWNLRLGIGLCLALIGLRIYVAYQTRSNGPVITPVPGGLAKGMESMRQSQEMVQKTAAVQGAAHKVRPTSPIGLLLSVTSGAYLRLGLESAITWSAARDLAFKLESSALSVEEPLVSTFTACPKDAATKEVAEDHIHLIPVKEKVFLICSPLASCGKFDASTTLKLRASVQANELKMGELFDVAWPQALCKPSATKSPAAAATAPVAATEKTSTPFAVSKAIVTVN